MRVSVGIREVAGHRVDLDILRHAHPQTFQQFYRSILSDMALVDILLVEGIEILIDSPVADCSSYALLEPRDRLNKPLRLNRLMECAGGIFGDVLAHLGNRQQVFLSLLIRLFGGHAPRKLSVAVGKLDDGVAHHDYGPEKRLFFDPLFGIHLVDGGQLLLGLFLNALDPALQHLLVVVVPCEAGAGGRRGRNDAEHFDQVARVFGQAVDIGVVILLTRPVWPKLFVDYSRVLLRQEELFIGPGRLRFLAEELFLQLRKQNGVAPGRAGAANDQVVLVDMDRDLLEDMGHSLAPS